MGSASVCSETYRLGSRMIEAIDDLAGELMGDREVFWAKLSNSQGVAASRECFC